MRAPWIVGLAACGALIACKSPSRKDEAAGGPATAPVVVDTSAAGRGPALPDLSEVAAVAADPAQVATAQDPARLAWQLFLFINWQAVPGSRGVPDPDGDVGAVPVVWQTWKERHDVDRAVAGDPAPWDDGGPSRPPTLSPGALDGTARRDVRGRPLTHTGYVDQRGFADEVTRRRAALAPVATAAAPTAIADAPAPAPEPAGLEVVAEWKVLDPIADKERLTHYITMQAILPAAGATPATTVGVGVTRLRLTARDRPGVTLVFEQLENPATLGEAPRAPDPGLARTSAHFQAALVGTPLAYYQLTSVQLAPASAMR